MEGKQVEEAFLNLNNVYSDFSLVFMFPRFPLHHEYEKELFVQNFLIDCAEQLIRLEPFSKTHHFLFILFLLANDKFSLQSSF